jgi:hypothetical protein
MVNLSDGSARRFRICARFVAHRGLSGSYHGNVAAQPMRPRLRFAVLGRDGVCARAALCDASPAQTLAALQDPLFCSVMKAHNDFRFWTID